MRIREGDALEIYTSADGEVIFKKYSPIGELSGIAGQFAEVLNRLSGLPALICDRDHVIAAAGAPRKEVLDKRLSEQLVQLMDARKSYLKESSTSPILEPAEGVGPAVACYPILSGSDVTGSVLLMGETTANEVHAKLAQATASFLAKQLGE